METGKHNLVAVYNTLADAQQARDRLIREGIPASGIRSSAQEGDEKHEISVWVEQSEHAKVVRLMDECNPIDRTGSMRRHGEDRAAMPRAAMPVGSRHGMRPERPTPKNRM